MTEIQMAPLVIIGAGDHGRVVLELLRAAGESPACFVEPWPAERTTDRVVDGTPVAGDLEHDLSWLGSVPPRFVVALGDNRARRDAFARGLALGMTPVAAIHPRATLLAGAVVEPGAVICAGAVVGLSAWIGPNAIVNTAATVDHDNRVGAHATIAPGAHLAGRVTIGEGAFVGIGAAVREGCTVGSWAFVAGGAMVVADVVADERVAGVPARPMAANEA